MGGRRESSYRNGDHGGCVEVADRHFAAVPVRDSKEPAGPALWVGSSAGAAFVEDLKG
ncbi:DUF397 domain-containing protein [Streptomyces sp. NPDC005438]|uniref:DUF397 domain-containing protein n=1 Tax=Streptomyces sp. NPDC005438 TaxID=3156880 RepID=UPI0033A234E0